MNQQQLHRKDRIRRFIPHPVKAAIIQLACSALMGRLIAGIFRNRIPHRGTTLLTRSPRVSPATKAMLFFEIYERSEIEQAQAYLAPGYDVVECGASIGANTTQLMRRATGAIVAVEADPELADVTRANLELNFGPRHKCVVVNAAIDYSGSPTVLFGRGDDNMRGKISAPREDASRNIVAVPAITLEKLLEQYGIGKFILVLDIEGAEAALFVQGGAALKNCYRIIGEFDNGMANGRWYSVHELSLHLGELGFHRIYGHGNRMVFQNEKMRPDAVPN